MKKIVFVGGGTMGSVMPLVAVAQALQKENSDFKYYWFGTFYGVERSFFRTKKEFKFFPVWSVKLRRYFDLRLIFLPLGLILGFLESLVLLAIIRPRLVVGAGSFVELPVAVAAWIWRVPVLIHQQDLRPGLANRLTAPFVTKISVVFPPSMKFFLGKKTVAASNSLRQEIFTSSDAAARDFFKLESGLPVILVLGGSTGALVLNEQIKNILPDLLAVAQVIHVTGRGKKSDFEHPRYKAYDFLGKEIFDALAVADIVVSRAGLGSLTELSHFGSPTILAPMRGTHQEDNAEYACAAGAALCLERDDVNLLKEKINGLLFNTEKRLQLSKNMRELFPTKQTLTDVVREMLG